ncbi:MAG: AAA family ATPase, partial [Rhodospirillales bacterium]|nr:AAA family ATPase [Rhodospirillales bacterium]
GGALGVAVGVAGSGKTTLLRPLVDAWRAQGDEVHGVALAWRQAVPLAEAGIEPRHCAALAPFLEAAQAGRLPLGPGSVVVVDELGQVGARQMLDLLRLRERHGFRIVALGDDRQCQAIEAGPVVSLLRRALGEAAIPEILSTRRQRSARERRIAGLFRDGRAAEALTMKREDGTAEAVPGGYDDAVRRVAALWRERRAANVDVPGFSLTVTAPSNADARAVSLALRAERRAMGELGADLVSIRAIDQTDAAYGMTLAVGDRVRLFARTNAKFRDGGRGNIGNNGSVLEVRDIAADGLLLRTAAGRDGLVAWDSLADKVSGRIRLAPGDVLTIDAAQGITSHEHISAMPAGAGGVQGFKGYVAASRHSEKGWLITSDGAERREIADRRALGDARPITAKDVWANVARNLSRQPDKDSALAFLDRARGIGRGAAHAMQAGFRRTEARTVAGRPAATLGARWRQRRDARAVVAAATRLRERLDARWTAVRVMAGRLRQGGTNAAMDIGQGAVREARRREEGEAKAMRDRARDNHSRAEASAAKHRAAQPRDERATQPVDAAAYWQRIAAAGKEVRASVRRAARRRREEGAVAAVADRLAVALDERGMVLGGLRQGRDEVPAQAAEGIRPVSPTLEKEAAVSALRRREPARFSQTEVAADFAAALQGAGLRVSGPVAMDGVLRRAPVEGDRKGQKSGSYVGHLDGWPAGYIRNHKTGEEV